MSGGFPSQVSKSQRRSCGCSFIQHIDRPITDFIYTARIIIWKGRRCFIIVGCGHSGHSACGRLEAEAPTIHQTHLQGEERLNSDSSAEICLVCLEIQSSSATLSLIASIPYYHKLHLSLLRSRKGLTHLLLDRMRFFHMIHCNLLYPPQILKSAVVKWHISNGASAASISASIPNRQLILISTETLQYKSSLSMVFAQQHVE